MNTNKPNAASAPAERKSAVVKTRPEDIVIWSNVVAQQQRARMRKALSTHNFPYPLFELLSHLAKDPGRKWSVTELAADFNTGQPGISKRLYVHYIISELEGHRVAAAAQA